MRRGLPNPDAFVLRHSVFPLLAITREGEGERVFGDPHEQGSAFFLNHDGLFLTARHVVEGYEMDAYSMIAVNLRERARKFCRLSQLERHPTLDVAVGIAERPGENGWPFPLALATSRVGLGGSVLVYGYPATDVSSSPLPGGDHTLGLDFHPRVLSVKVDDYMPEAPYIKAPCYVVSGDHGGGLSGSPMIRKRTGRAHAIVCRGTTTDDPASPSYGLALDLRSFVDDWRVAFLEGRTLREHCARIGHPIW